MKLVRKYRRLGTNKTNNHASRVKGAAMDSNLIHVMSNLASIPLRSASCPFYVCAEKTVCADPSNHRKGEGEGEM